MNNLNKYVIAPLLVATIGLMSTGAAYAGGNPGSKGILTKYISRAENVIPVQKGDSMSTLYEIGKEQGYRGSLENLIKVNGIKDPSKVQIGTKVFFYDPETEKTILKKVRTEEIKALSRKVKGVPYNSFSSPQEEKKGSLNTYVAGPPATTTKGVIGVDLTDKPDENLGEKEAQARVDALVEKIVRSQNSTQILKEKWKEGYSVPTDSFGKYLRVRIDPYTMNGKKLGLEKIISRNEKTEELKLRDPNFMQNYNIYALQRENGEIYGLVGDLIGDRHNLEILGSGVQKINNSAEFISAIKEIISDNNLKFSDSYFGSITRNTNKFDFLTFSTDKTGTDMGWVFGSVQMEKCESEKFEFSPGQEENLRARFKENKAMINGGGGSPGGGPAGSDPAGKDSGRGKGTGDKGGNVLLKQVPHKQQVLAAKALNRRA